MPSSLTKYKQKRNFQITSEPGGERTRPGKSLRFVVQKHAARALHYDFRLELDGVLKSWAVPKGPSLDPAVKRLAVHVEDHPLAYADFEGTIPARQYGAGKVEIWDRGQWRPDGNPRADYQAGKLKFLLQGQKLHGGWALVRTRLPATGDKEQWLLIKERDEEARDAADFDVTASADGAPVQAKGKLAASDSRKVQPNSGKRKDAHTTLPEDIAVKCPLPKTLKPQLATLVQSPPGGDEDWEYEIKFDGYRVLARIEAGSVRLFTRNGNDWTHKLPALVKAIKGLGLKTAWLDGEIVAKAPDGTHSFQALQNAFDNQHTDALEFYLFDMPYVDGYDLRSAPLRDRRMLLRQLLDGRDNGLLHYSESFSEKPERVLTNACKLGLEGVIGKRVDASYTSGRTRAWIKLKCQRRQEFVVCGFTEPQGSRTGFGALLLGVHEKDGELRYAGRVGTGFDDAQLRSIHKQLRSLEVSGPPFSKPPHSGPAQRAHWIKPTLVVEVSFAQWTNDGLLRHAVFEGVRTDKLAKEIERERPVLPPATTMKNPAKRALAAKQQKEQNAGDAVAGPEITHPDRVIEKGQGFTKLDLARYYAAVHPWILPHLHARPVALLRGPDGIDGELFFQKHVQHLIIPGAKILDAKFDPGHAPLMAIESNTALVGAVQMGAMEFHTWNATTSSIERPDRMILDLDPDPALGWATVVEAAQLSKALLDELGLRSFVKTSGGRGLHLVVPLARRHTWDDVSMFAQSLARHMAGTIPDRFSAKMGPQNRVKKVFVDYLRNRRGASTVAAYSVRARTGLPVSVPVAWEELVQIHGSDEWNIATMPQRLAKRKTDPWADYLKSAQILTHKMKKMLGL